MGTLADAQTNDKTHVIHSATAGRFLLADLNALMTRSKRVNTSFDGGTPERRGRGITDLVCSPEVVEELRSMAYNPINNKGVGSTTPDGSNAGVAAPDSVREQLFTNAGIPEFYGVSIMEINELGVGQKFNTIFNTLASGKGFNDPHSGGSPEFVAASEEIVIGLDLVAGRDAMLRAVATDPDSNADFSLVADDQYSVRQKKIGYFGSVEEGRMIVDNRVLFGVIV